MKKKITTGQELFIQIAAHGDAAAFFSMISPALRDHFLKLCSHGESVEASAQKVYETAETLFKKLQNAHPDNFDHWVETEFASLSHGGTSEHEIILDKNLFRQCEKVLEETQKVLFRAASIIKSKQKKKGVTFFWGRHKITTAVAILVVLVSILTAIFFGYYGFEFDMSFLNVKLNKNIQQTNSTADSPDTTKKVDSIANAAAQNPPVQETSPTPPPPPPPKPRPKVSYTTPAASDNEGSGTYPSSRTSAYEQSQQSIQSRSERVGQTSSYPSQNQSSENSTASLYNSSGNSNYSSQVSTQTQLQGTLEQNQP